MVVIYAEKHSLAKTIASALGSTKRIPNINNPTIAHWECTLDGQPAVIVHGAGHLCSLFDAKNYDEKYSKWDLDIFPCIPQEYKLKEKDGTSDLVEQVRYYFDKADIIINAADADREGELIFAYIYEYLNCNKPWMRVWLTDLTNAKIKEAFANLKDSSDMMNLQQAGRARRIADWLTINLSVAATVKFGSKDNLISVGRVQTPTLNLIVQREKEIESFQKKKLWKIRGLFNNSFYAESETKFENEAEAQFALDNCRSNSAVVTKVEKQHKTYPAPLLYNTTQLQADACQKFNWSVDKTTSILQSLYEKAFVSYPRTASEHLTDAMIDEVYNTVEKVMKTDTFAQYAIPREDFAPPTERHFDNSKVDSHTAIIPTGSVPSDLNTLSEDEKELYIIIALSVIRIVYPNAEADKTAIEIDVKGNIFKAKGKIITNEGWYAVDAPQDNSFLPDLAEGEAVQGTYEAKSYYTEPPKRYTEATLIRAMEKAGKDISDEEILSIMKLDNKGLGTAATRAEIISTMYKRNFIKKAKGNAVVPTEKGRYVIDTLGEIIPSFLSVDLTGELEKQLKDIEKGKTDYREYIATAEKNTKVWFEAVKNSNAGRMLDGAEKLMCPYCKKPLVHYKSGYGCSTFKESGCNFYLRNEICGKTLTQTQQLMLLQSGRTGIIKGFTAKSGKKFDAALKIDAQKKTIEFVFPQSKSNGKTK